MKADSIAYVIAGICFGVILGWVIGTQQARRPGPAPTAAAPVAEGQSAGNPRQASALDEGRVQALTTIIKSDPKNADAVVQLANTYFDAEHWDDAIQWYRRAVELDAKNADASTDLGVSLYYTNKADEALAQFEHSLKIDPKHTKTLLNKGIVLAFGKQDLKAASEEWKKVVTLAPDSPEGQAARRALEGVANAHAGSPASNP
jgi:tetratricopeptide (TPR) repeat protein